MNGKQLKNSILQWAIQGKLVPQDPYDEPASVLLDKIRQEKERLIKEKKIKRDKNASIIYRGEDNSYYEKILATGEVKCIDEEIPFEVPQGWEWCRASSVILPPKYGTSNKSVGIGSVPVLRMGNIQDGEIDFTKLVYSNNEIDNEKYKLQNGDLLFNRTNSAELVGKTGIFRGNRPAIFAGYIILLRPILVCSDFLNFVFGSPYVRSYCKDVKTIGVQQCNINAEKVSNLLIPIAPLGEQKRIVDKINSLSANLSYYNRSQQKLDELNDTIRLQLKKSILQEAIQGRLVSQIAEEGTATELLELIKTEKQKLVKDGKLKKSSLNDSVIFKGDDNKYYEKIDTEVADITAEIPFELPAAWTWCRLRDICQIMTGATFKKDEANNSGIGVRVLRGGNISPFKLQLKSDDLYVHTDKVKEAILLKKNDIVTPAVTSLENIGKMALVSEDLHNITVGGFVFIIRSHLTSNVFAKYLQYIMSAPATIEFMQSITNKSGQAFYNIGKERLNAALIPIPPIGEIQRINDKIETIFSLS